MALTLLRCWFTGGGSASPKASSKGNAKGGQKTASGEKGLRLYNFINVCVEYSFFVYMLIFFGRNEDEIRRSWHTHTHTISLQSTQHKAFVHVMNENAKDQHAHTRVHTAQGIRSEPRHDAILMRPRWPSRHPRDAIVSTTLWIFHASPCMRRWRTTYDCFSSSYTTPPTGP